MSKNCIRCVVKSRTGGDLLCDECRAKYAAPLETMRCDECDCLLVGMERAEALDMGFQECRDCSIARHRCIPVTLETSDGPVEATITGDPNMPPETAAALRTMMSCVYEALKSGELDVINEPDERPKP